MVNVVELTLAVRRPFFVHKIEPLLKIKNLSHAGIYEKIALI